jgi:hypothetical protein
MQRKGFLVVAAVLLAALPAAAEEIIYFTNGSSLPVRGHVIEGEMIKVDLGDDGVMAFPRFVVDKIVEAPRGVVLKPSPTNRIVGGNPLTRVYATPPQERDGWELPDQGRAPVNRDERGLAVDALFPGTDHAGKAKMNVPNFDLEVADSPYEGRLGSANVGVGHKVVHPSTPIAKAKNMKTFAKKGP